MSCRVSDLCIILPCFHSNVSEEQLFPRHLCAYKSACGNVCRLQIKQGDKTVRLNSLNANEREEIKRYILYFRYI